MSKIVRTLPSIKVPIGHIPQRLKTQGFENPQGRLEILRRMITRLFREERCEFKYNRAEECRQYAERIIQLGIHRGRNDDHTMEMLRWWFMQPFLIDKFFGEIVPRLKDTPEPYTFLIKLPRQRLLSYSDSRISHYHHTTLGSLEINGNRFPDIRKLEENRQEALKEYVRKHADVKE
ncbi:hypothetical protein M3Y97_00816200 [Aphelenchoides bicaudatus]|nr:hypothetical protein M3Y97_00816200 [Aphelenchoides bicaudatus]